MPASIVWDTILDMLSRRGFLGMLAGALAAPKELLTKPLLMKFRQPGITTAAFDIAYMQTEAAMVFEPMFYYQPSITVNSPRSGFVLKGLSVPEGDEC